MDDVFVCGSMTLRVGDDVGVSDGGFGGVPTVKKVERITHKGKRVRLECGSEFNNTGRSVGGSSYNRRYLMPADKARKLADPRDNRRAMLKAANDVCEKLRQITNAHDGPDFTPITESERAELIAMIQRM
jgi:hypothetical protein